MHSYFYENAPSLKLDDPSPQMPYKLLRQLISFHCCAVHEVLGLKDLEFQSLYHFTVGAPVLDKRIMSLPAYPGPGIDA
jgi:hypothetical protein